MNRLILGVSMMLGGILLVCAAVIAGGLIATTDVFFLDISYKANQSIVWIVLIGALFAIGGLILALIQAFGKKD